MHNPSSGPHLSTLILLSALAIVPISFFLPSLPRMATDFGVDYGVMGLSLALYAATSAALQLVLGPLSDRFGRRPVILVALGIFVLATLGCIFATDIVTFLACRMAQAVVAPTYAVAMASIRDTATKEQSAGKFGYLAMSWAVAPMLAPGLGGFLDQAFGWQATFIAMALLGVGVFCLCWFDFGETNHKRSGSIRDQYRAYPDLICSARFWAYSFCMAFSVGAFYAFLVGAPLAAKHLSPSALGLSIGSITAGFMVGSFLAGRFSGRFALTTILVSGRLVAVVALAAGLLAYSLGIAHLLALFIPCVFVGFSNGLTQPSANAGALSVRPQQAGSAAGLASAVAVTGGSAMSGLAGAVLTEGNARYALLLVMLVSACLALAAALTARHSEKAARAA